MGRGSSLPIYAFSGALLVGKSGTAFGHLKHLWPATLFSIDMVASAMSNVFTSIQRMVALYVIPKTLLYCPPEDSIVGGLSLGSRPAFCTASFISTISHSVRATFMLDDRGKDPMPPRLLLAQRQVFRRALLGLHDCMTRDTIERYKTDTIGLLTDFQAVVRVRLQQPLIEFAVPSRDQEDAAISFFEDFCN